MVSMWWAPPVHGLICVACVFVFVSAYGPELFRLENGIKRLERKKVPSRSRGNVWQREGDRRHQLTENGVKCMQPPSAEMRAKKCASNVIRAHIEGLKRNYNGNKKIALDFQLDNRFECACARCVRKHKCSSCMWVKLELDRREGHKVGFRTQTTERRAHTGPPTKWQKCKEYILIAIATLVELCAPNETFTLSMCGDG